MVSKSYQMTLSLVISNVGLLVAGPALAGSLDPSNTPGPTMHTLEEIYVKVALVASPQIDRR